MKRSDLSADDLPFEVQDLLGGWSLFWAYLIVDGATDAASRDAAFSSLRENVASRVRERFPDNKALAAADAVQALRKLFKGAGCDPSRYRPSSEALLRRLVRGDAMLAIHPLVDLNNCLSAELAVPCCVMRPETFGRGLTFRVGEEGESYLSLRGPFNLAKKPLLVDEARLLDTPITGNSEVKVDADSGEAWLVAYLPADVVSLAEASSCLKDLARGTGIHVETWD